MPYDVKQDGTDFVVVNTETGKVKARHSPPDADSKAHRQVQLLNEIEKDPSWEAPLPPPPKG